MSSPIIPNQDDSIVRYTNKTEGTTPREAPTRDFKQVLQKDERGRKEERRSPLSEASSGYKKGSTKEKLPIADDDTEGLEGSSSNEELPADSANRVIRKRPVEQRKEFTTDTDDEFSRNFFDIEEIPTSSSTESSESPSESLDPQLTDIAALLKNRRETPERPTKAPSLFDLQAQTTPPKQPQKTESAPYHSSFAQAFASSKNKEGSATEQTLTAEEGQAMSAPVQEPSPKKMKTSIEIASELRARDKKELSNQARIREDLRSEVKEDHAEAAFEKKSDIDDAPEKGDRSIAAALTAQTSLTAQIKTGGSDPVSTMPLSVSSQDAQIKELLKMIDHLYTASVNGDTNTTFEIRDPNSIFNGARIVLSIHEQAPTHFDVSIDKLSDMAKNLIEMRGHQEALRSAFEQKGITLHTILATTNTLPDETLGLARSDESFRDQRKGDEEEGRQGGRQKREREES